MSIFSGSIPIYLTYYIYLAYSHPMTDSATPAFTPAEATAALIVALQPPMDGITVPDVKHITDLIAQGADLEARDAGGMTALLRCLSWGCPASNRGGMVDGVHRVLTLLLQNGADLDAKTSDGLGAPDLATKWNDQQWATKKLGREAFRRTDPKLMAEVAEISTSWPKPGETVTDQMKRTFMIACHNGMMDEIRYTLYLYPDAVNWYEQTWNTNGGTPLMAAINHGGHKIDVARLLIERGADVNLQNENGMTALHFAVSRGNGSEEFIDVLVAAGANEHIKTAGGFDVMAQAEMKANPVFIERLRIALQNRDTLRADQESIIRTATTARLDTLRDIHARGAQRFKF